MNIRELWCLTLFVLGCMAGVASAEVTFTEVGHLPGGNETDVRDISDDGITVVGSSAALWNPSDPIPVRIEAFRWTRSTGIVGLGAAADGDPTTSWSRATGVSADGSVIVGDTNSDWGGGGSYRWTSDTGMMLLGSLPSVFPSSWAHGVSADGSVVVGGSHTDGPIEATRWSSATGIVGLGHLDPDSSTGTSLNVSPNGLVIVGYDSTPSTVPGRTQTDPQAMRWSMDSGMEGLGYLHPPPLEPWDNSYRSFSNAASADGSVIVGDSVSTANDLYRLQLRQGFRWTREAGMVGLPWMFPSSGPLDLNTSSANDISASGVVTVGNIFQQAADGTTLVSCAARWSTRGSVLCIEDMLIAGGVDLAGWTLWGGNIFVSASGNVIAGSGISPGSHRAAWVADLGANPIADAGDSQSLLQLGSVSLDGSESLDPDGHSISYRWSLEVPPGSSAALDDPTSTTPGFVADQYGDYVATLVVTDQIGLISDPATVSVGFANLAPVAEAGTDQVVVVGDTVGLDGNGSSDPNMDSLTFAWRLESVPAGSTATLIGAMTATPWFFADMPGDYDISLVVNDGMLDSTPDTVQVVAISRRDGALGAAMDLVAAINELDSGDFSNRNMQRTLITKVNVIIRMIERGDYASAISKLNNDVLAKTDGCATTGAPDGNDWINNCAAQGSIYPRAIDLIDLLTSLLMP